MTYGIQVAVIVRSRVKLPNYVPELDLELKFIRMANEM